MPDHTTPAGADVARAIPVRYWLDPTTYVDGYLDTKPGPRRSSPANSPAP